MSAPLLPRFTARAEQLESERKIARIILETCEAAPATVAGATLAGDWRRMRGLPCVSRGVGGAVRGAQPEQALMNRERRIGGRR